ncbi:FUSC family protein [Lutibacter citreus]|uniref:FUSC family protein n=1 Tax=Lutibacter citreus TaxID=2138210 RepID=UPI0015D0CB05|nr:FUSC family membrane protein [Lutibacter citreus]
MIAGLKRFFKSVNFVKAIVIGIATVSPVLISNFVLGSVSIGFSVSLGVVFCSPAYAPGSLKHLFFGLLSAILLAFSMTFITGSISSNIYVFLPLLVILVFLISYISIFGFRASLISFTGLLAIVLSFTQNSSNISLINHSLLVALGGFWLLGLVLLANFLFPKIQTDGLFVETIEKTAEFLKLRGKLLVEKENRDALFKRMFELQTELNENHENIREVILRKRINSGFSNRTRREQLLFAQLMEMYDLAISNPVDYDKFDLIFEDHQEKIVGFKKLMTEIGNQLEHISKVILKQENLKENLEIKKTLFNIKTQIDYYRILVGLPKSRVGTIMLLNLKTYQEKQVQRISGIERILNNYIHNDKIVAIKDAERFITPQDYDLKKLWANFNLKSPIFKHSLRLSVTMALGFILGSMFEMQNSYWVLLTLVVIMRPSYGLTKERSKNRVIGTLIGAVIAVSIIFITQNIWVYGVIAVISLPIALSFIQLNYRNAAVFITLHVIFIYASLEPNILEVIKFRVLDTVIGAGLAFTANYFLWPAWQIQNINEFLIKTISANKVFLKEIDTFYHNKGELPTSYKLARKDSFLKVGDLNAAYQRMNQEPKSKKKELGEIYELVTFSNTFLSSLSALGMFLRTNKTMEVPKQFETYIKYISKNLDISVQLLNNEFSFNSQEKIKLKEAQEFYDNYFDNLSKQRDQEILEGKMITETMKIQLHEIQLVSEQLKWLLNLSENIINGIKQLNLTKEHKSHK